MGKANTTEFAKEFWDEKSEWISYVSCAIIS